MTQNHWSNLYLTSVDGTLSADDIAEIVRGTLEANGFITYDPFGGVPGRTYDQAVRLFVAPPQENWGRVLVNDTLPEVVLRALSQRYVCLWLHTNGDTITTDVYAGGQRADDPTVTLAPFLRSGKLPEDLRSALNQPDITIIDPEQPETYMPPTDVLPDDVQQMAQDVDSNAVNRLFDRIAGGIFGRTGGDRDAANELIDSARSFNWSSPAGWKVRSMMDMLTVPAGWQHPDFKTLRDAYSLQARRKRTPNARLYPGDERAIAAVPDALSYIPVYAGKDV